MDISPLIAAVAAFGLPCSNPELRDYPPEDLPWPAAYVRSIDGHNVIALRGGIRDDMQRLPKILVHELLHCGLYEDRQRRGQPQPRSLDPREEIAVQAMTEAVLKRLNGSSRESTGDSAEVNLDTITNSARFTPRLIWILTVTTRYRVASAGSLQ